jgi:amidase
MLKTKPVDYASATAGALARALAERDVSAIELFDAAVARIEAEDGPINAVVVRDFDRAREAAKAADAALARGEARPLLGVPMTVKESHDVAGLPTTWGHPEHAGWIAKADATGVARLKGAGAVVLGKTNVPIDLSDWQSFNAVYGRTRNPHDLARSPGGSSGGAAAALAAGMVPLEYGSDIGGSIRVPAHFCGVFGHKPTYGLVPGTGHAPPGLEETGAPSEFGVVGPLARSASDLELALNVLAGPEGDMAAGYRLALPPARAGRLKDFRVLVLDRHPACATDVEVSGPLNRLAEALAAAGARVSHESPLLPDLSQAHQIYMGLLLTIFAKRAAGEKPPVDTFTWLTGLDVMTIHRRRWSALFREFDVVLAPPHGVAAFPHSDETNTFERTLTVNGETTPAGDQLAWPGTASFPGLPSTCAPVSKTPAGLPVGVQIIGPWLSDLTTIAFAGLVSREIGEV